MARGLAALLRRLPRVAFAKDPSAVPPGTIVLLPIRRATLHCGLAGFVEIAKPAPFAAPAVSEILRLAKEAAARSVRSLAKDPAAAGSYAGGEGTPAALLDLAHSLRRPAAVALGAGLPPLEAAAAEAAASLRAFCDAEEAALEEVAAALPGAVQESVAARLVALRDAAWSLDAEFLGMLARARELAGPGAGPKLLVEMRRIVSALDSIDRIEVRGRDSAGILVMAIFPSAKEADAFRASHAAEIRDRSAGSDLLDGAVAVADTGDPAKPVAISFVRKVAEEVGRLGDNVAALREGFRGDGLLRAALSHPATRSCVLAHTRWASNGIIHPANAHPVDNATVPSGRGGEADEVRPQGEPHPVYGRARGRVFVALNGDVDNHLPLHDAYEAATGRRGSPRVTTDTKVIALQVDRKLREGMDLESAFRAAVADLEGSAAVAMASDLEPGRVFLSLRGSGQALHVGAAPDGWVIASEVYGLVHETSSYASLEGGPKGSVTVLDAGFDPGELRRATITTRDVDRGDFPHFFLKEIAQSPVSVAKTLRGRFALEGEGGRRLRMNLGAEVLPPAIEARLQEKRIRRVLCVGQGTASVAAAAIAEILDADLSPAGVAVRAGKASELSGFGLRDDMSEVLLIAVTQSGSTADTNRAVDLARKRGAAVIAIVNRRASDITRRADGVFYTSDGRDVEMSVASTKAFHAQVAAGAVLSLALSRACGTLGEGEAAERARELRALPGLLREVLALDGEIVRVAAEHAPSRRHWTVVGSGLNRVAAEEIRIKCSELCYKSISADTVEDKKHIDLSAEALMLVLAAGNPPAVQGDLAKDVAIFQAHKGLPVVFAERGDARFDAYAAAVVPLPPAPPRLAMLAHVMAGHLFAYHAARAIDEGARFVSRIRARVVEGMVGGGGASLQDAIEDGARQAAERMARGRFDAALGAGRAADLVLRLQAGAVEPLIASLTDAVRELERPVDAIRHQAKIVTVGTSRTAERPAGVLFDALAEAGVAPDDAPDAAVAALRAVQPAVARVEGWAIYRVEGLAGDGEPTDATRIAVERRGGVSSRMPSRAEGGAPLKGTKRGVVGSRRAFIGIGTKDGRTVVILPLLDARLHCTAVALLHAEFREDLPVEAKVALLGHRRLEEIVNGVSETDVTWTDALLAPVPPKHLACFSTEKIVEEIVARARRA